ncbi:MAG: hypothetical protein JJD93_08035 [Ilumatobacteraceae bacterium]|nr:hypothetical protein [Ilumatobacteraceae bacterium]
MGRFHYHADGTGHSHEDGDHEHGHDHDRTNGHGGVSDHSGYQTGGLRVDVLEKILGENDRTAEANRSDFYDANVHVVNLMSSPGAGKTTLLREVLLKLGSSLRVGIVEGDVETSIDADRLAGLGAPVSLVNTANGFGGECHFDATMVRSALPRLPLADLDFDLELFHKNLGNVNPDVRTIETSAKTGVGVDEVCAWISSLAGRG